MRATFTVCGGDVALMAAVFRALEREFKFRRGFVEVKAVAVGCLEITATASDLTSLRSLINGVVKSIYLIETSLDIVG